MTPINLVKSLVGNLREVVADYKLVAELQKPKPVSVYEQYLPSDRFEVDTYYPLVIVSLVSVENTDKFQDRVATVTLQIATYGGEDNDGFDGWRDMFNISERICQFLYSTPIIDGKFPMAEKPIFVPAETQPIPFFYGYVSAKYFLAMSRF